jgi:hypothetical protein
VRVNVLGLDLVIVACGQSVSDEVTIEQLLKLQVLRGIVKN